MFAHLLRCEPRRDPPRHYPTDEELRELAEARVLRKLAAPDRKRTPKRTKAQILEEVKRRHIGLLGEREVALLLGVPMSLDVRHTGDARENLANAHGVPIDVITRTIPNNRVVPDLLLNTREAARPDLALVLVIYPGDRCQLNVVGWEWEREVRSRNHVVRYSQNDSYAYPAGYLRSIYSLAITEAGSA